MPATTACGVSTVAGGEDVRSLAPDASLTPLEAGAAAAEVLTEAPAPDPVGGALEQPSVVVTSVDESGRPQFHEVPADGATDPVAAVETLTADVVSDGGAVVAVEADRPVSTLATDPHRSVQWPLDRLDFEASWASSTGAGVCVAVVDNGAQTNHPDLAGRIVASQDFTGEGLAGSNHGTHVAGIIAAVAGNGVGVSGAAPGAELLNVKALASSGTGSTLWVAQGITWAVDHGAEVVNLSLGSACPQASPSGCASAAMAAAIDYAQTHDVVVVASGGNDGLPELGPGVPNPEHNYWSWPAALAWPIAVASTTVTDARSASSTQASYLDVAAPGNSVASTIAGGGYAYMSGTSMAAPYVSALAALLRGAHPSETAAQIRQRIIDHTVDLGPTGLDDDFGWGLIDPGASIG